MQSVLCHFYQKGAPPPSTGYLDVDMTVQQERLYATEDGFDPADLVAGRRGGHAVATAVQRINCEFADTHDARLLRWGVTLTHERGGGWRLRDAHVDHTVAGVGVGVPPDAADLVFGVARGDPVSVRARARVIRRGVDFVGRHGGALAAVRVDEVELVEAGGSRPVPFTLVRLVWAPGTSPKVVRRLRHSLERHGCRQVEATWATARLLGGATAHPEVPTKKLGPKSRLSAVVAGALGTSALRLVGHDPATRVGDDPEGVHQMRVATRRLRSDLDTFGKVLDGSAVTGLRSELAWLAHLLGAVRDADVLGERLAVEVTTLAGSDRVGGERLLARLVEDRAAARAVLLEAMGTTRYAALLEQVVALARKPPLAAKASRRAAGVAGAFVPDRRLMRAARRLADDPSSEALHKVRIRAKRCRYAAEAVAPVVGGDARRYAAVMQRCQDVLGAHTDAVVAQEWLRRVAAHGSRHEAFVAGFLAGRERGYAEAQRALWPALRKELLAKDLRRWLR